MKKYLSKLIIFIVDLFLLICLFFLTLFIRKNLHLFGLPVFNGFLLFNFLFIIFIILGLMYYEGIYSFRYDFWQETLKIIKVFVFSFLIVLTMLVLTKTSLNYSRLFIAIYFILGIILIPIFKRFVKKILYHYEIFKIKVLIIGIDSEVQKFKKEIDENWYLGQKYSEHDYQSVIIISKNLSINQLNKIINKYFQRNSELFVVPYITDIDLSNSKIMEYSNMRYNAIQIENKLLIKKNTIIKIVFDKIISVFLLPFFMIIHIIVSILIKLESKGNIFFKQTRLGKDDIDFEVFKYRTMYENGDIILKKYLKNHPEEIQYYEKYHKYKNDPRITKIGKILRATSIDELPQILNVLKGDMSLVGPRPYMINEKEKLEENKYFILKVKPGITGLWQVSGRNNLTFKKRNELEVWYIKNWSLWIDFIILIKTIKVIFLKIGAK